MAIISCKTSLGLSHEPRESKEPSVIQRIGKHLTCINNKIIFVVVVAIEEQYFYIVFLNCISIKVTFNFFHVLLIFSFEWRIIVAAVKGLHEFWDHSFVKWRTVLEIWCVVTDYCLPESAPAAGDGDDAASAAGWPSAYNESKKDLTTLYNITYHF